MSAAAIVEGLSEAQRRVVTHEAGPVIVIAGPGAGKTHVLIRRIAWLIACRGADPASILALTFTNKAAAELRSRLAGLPMIGAGAAERITACTFNALGMNLIHRFSDVMGLPRRLLLIDSAQRRRLARELATRHGLFTDAIAEGLDSAIDLAHARIAVMFHAGLAPATAAAALDARAEALDRLAHPPPEASAEAVTVHRWRDAARLWAREADECRRRGWIGFDDQIRLPTDLLRGHAMARDAVRGAWQHVVVDEFQDVNVAQIELLRLLAPPDATRPPSITIVGDDDQAIYGFRGADDLALERFRDIWSLGGAARVATLTLTDNYRSGSAIIDAANTTITRAHHRFVPDKQMTPAGGAAPAAVEAVWLDDDGQEGELIRSMLATDRAAHPDRPWSSYAVIARTHTDLARIRATLEVEGIPVAASRAANPVDDPGVQDLLAWIELVLRPDAAWAARRLLRRPPYSVDPSLLASLERRLVASRSRDPAAASVNAARWLADAVPADHADHASYARIAEQRERFAALVGEHDAFTVIERIIREAGLAHAELLGPRERAGRVRALIAVLRFVKACVPRLEQPRDLAAFMAYHRDLDDTEQTFGDRGLGNDQAEGDAEAEGADAVALITAHAAKGLEFDTVFVPRVNSPHGFPKRSQRDEDTDPPACLTSGLPSPRTAEQAHADEERRLFYVACTRAKRRLVVFSKLPKKLGKDTVYLADELRGAPGGLIERRAGDILGAAAMDAITRLAAEHWKAAHERRERFTSARRDARVLAAEALHAADAPGISEAQLNAVATRLRDAASLLALTAAAQAGGPLPAWAASEAERSLFAHLTAAEAPAGAGPTWMRPQPAPLGLSYSLVADVRRCPRCAYLRHIEGLPEAMGSKQVVGSAVHMALAKFADLYRDAESEGLPVPPVDELIGLGDRCFEEATPADEPLDELQRSQVRAQLSRVWAGFAGAKVSIRAVEERLEMPYPSADDPRHRLVAKLDRWDELGTGVYRIVDYKTGASSTRLLEPRPDDLQMGIYAMVLAHSLGFSDVADLRGTAEYWLLATGQRGVIGFDALAAKQDKVRAVIDDAVTCLSTGRADRGKDCWGLCDLFTTD